MPGNRVDRLEQQVQELEATVEGLTEELVEANERIRQLEEALAGDEESSSSSNSATPDPTGTDAVELADAETFEDGNDGGSPDGVDDDLERQFEVADEADPEDVEAAASQVMAEDAADTSNTSEDESGDEGDTDDIIVA
jgi:uncharacterized coiled-coil protein SlyX